MIYSMLRLLLCISTVGTLWAAPYNNNLNEQWENFKRTFNKKYEGREEGARRMIYEENVQRIVRHNLQADMGQHSYWMGINKFADLTRQEFRNRVACIKRRHKSNGSSGITFRPPLEVKVPDQIDWVKKGYVTVVKDQGSCGSCWSFATTGTLEGQHKKSTGELVSLSEQNLVDCSTNGGNEGCDGGFVNEALKYVIENHGLDTESSYPYEEKDAKCRFRKRDIGANCSSSVAVEGGDEESLKTVVAITGPVAAYISTKPDSFQFYKKGVYEDEECKANDYDHAVLVVGYGKMKEKEFWLVKNSWGTDWGKDGYIKIARNKNNMCGIADVNTFPMA